MNLVELIALAFMKQFLILLFVLFSHFTFSQDYIYSFISESKAFQETNNNGDVINYSLWKPTTTKIVLTEEKCTITESGITAEYLIKSSNLNFKNDLTKINIKAVKNEGDYELELVVVDKNKYLFLISGANKIDMYKTNKITKTELR